MSASTVVRALSGILLPAFLAGCATAPLSEVEPVAGPTQWRVHCETEKTYALDIKAIPGVYHGQWQWAKDEQDNVLYLKGELSGGFFLLDSVSTDSGVQVPAEASALRERCLQTIAADQPTDLARVMAARDSRDLDIPIVYPKPRLADDEVTRLVVFGDSLSDAGRLKHRMEVFPGSPYWLGRFSNGPVWTDYLESAAALPVQNRSYGGASINPPLDLDESGLVGFVKDEGRFFVSGSLADQVSSYLEDQHSTPGIDRPDTTAYIIWAGANDYISKEPVTGLITTFLNTTRGEFGYKSVTDDTVKGMLEQVSTLYEAGARRFLVVNMPDLGWSPIVLQNDSYNSGLGRKSDTGRRIELSQRLSLLSEYHNEVLSKGVNKLREDMPDAQILMVDSHGMSQSIFDGHLFTSTDTAFDYGFTLTQLQETLEYKDVKMALPQPCYTGVYLGSFSEDEICELADSAFFWDVIHPTTFTHCWQAYLVGTSLASAGWLQSMPAPADYRTWCQAQVSAGYH
ncbi:MAG: SGNH/GDSL hydrolase family protein [Halieaceae bacterium]